MSDESSRSTDGGRDADSRQRQDEGTGRPIRVLVVDDQTLLRQSFQRLLELEGDTIEVVGGAGNGREALDALAALERAGRLPDVVLMDVRMPVMDGVTATARLRERWPSVRVLILSTFDDEEYVLAGLQAGARGYLLKDVTAQDLLQAIRAVARGDAPLQPSVAAKLVAHLTGLPRVPNVPGRAGTAPRSAGLQPGRSDASLGAPPVPGGVAGLPTGGDGLTEREREILTYLAQGASNREIGEALFITEGTVKNHVSNILSKLCLRDRTQAALWAREHGLA